MRPQQLENIGERRKKLPQEAMWKILRRRSRGPMRDLGSVIILASSLHEAHSITTYWSGWLW